MGQNQISLNWVIIYEYFQSDAVNFKIKHSTAQLTKLCRFWQINNAIRLEFVSCLLAGVFYCAISLMEWTLFLKTMSVDQ